MKQRPPLYTLAHGIEVIGEYAPTAKNPYWRVRVRPHPFIQGVIVANGICTRRSKVMAAAKFGRLIGADEHVHHGDGKGNDDQQHLEILTASEHNKHHKTGSKHTEATKRKIADSVRRAHAISKLNKLEKT
jgi:hypothetical protein